MCALGVQVVQERNDLGVRLLDRHEELALFYEKYNHYDKVLRNGDVAVVERDDDIRLLKLERSDCQRSIAVLRKSAASQQEQEAELISLRTELLELYCDLECQVTCCPRFDQGVFFLR